MKLTKRIIATTLSVVLFATCLVGCGDSTKKGKGNSATDIEISVWNAGYGVEYLEKIADAFEKKHPEYDVTITATANAEATVAAFGLENVDTVDLYIAPMATFDFTYMESLNDVLDSTIEGEGKTLREKFNPAYLNIETAADGNVYTLSANGSVMNFVYNEKIFGKAGITQLPRTTNEFIALCDTLYGKGITPLCHFTGGGYYNFLLDLYAAQYNGYDYFQNQLYANADADGTTPSKAAYTNKDGRYQALKVFEKFITPEYTLLGSNTKSHTEVQTEFVNESVAMMFNGAWLKNEVASSGSIENFRFMKTPVISAIIQRLDTVKSDSDLRKVITAVDKVTDDEKQLSEFASGDSYVIEGLTVSAQDWDAVYEARNMAASNYGGTDMLIPTYSNAKEGAKEFLKYFYSDEGYKLYVDTLGVPLPLSLSTGEELDVSDKTQFEQFQFQAVSTTSRFVERYMNTKSALFGRGGIDIIAKQTFADSFSTQNGRDRKNADEVWNDIIAAIEENYESVWLKNIE